MKDSTDTALVKLTAAIGVLLAIVAIVALNAWWVMVLWGALSSIFDWWPNPISFGEAIVVAAGLGFIGNLVRSR